MSVAKKLSEKKKPAGAAQIERYVRILELPRQPGDAFTGYQPEIILVQNDRVISREQVSKPNLFEYAFTQAGELIDPRNVVPTEEVK